MNTRENDFEKTSREKGPSWQVLGTKWGFKWHLDVRRLLDFLEFNGKVALAQFGCDKSIEAAHPR